MATQDRDSSESTQSRQADDLFWHKVAEQIDRLAELRSARGDRAGDSLDLRRLIDGFAAGERSEALVELIKFDLEHCWRERGERVAIETYVERYADVLDHDRLPFDLILEEVQLRIEAGEVVVAGQLCRRFPGQAAEIEAWFAAPPACGAATANFRSSRYDVRTAAPTLRTAAPGSRRVPAGKRGFLEGDRVDDFDLLLKLGEGSFASVFLARQRSLERLVALKISSDQGSEPQTLARLDHPNIVRVFDQRSFGDPPLRLLYMEVVAGGSLLDVLRAATAAPIEQRTGSLVLAVIDSRLAASGMAPPEGSQIRQSLAVADWPTVVAVLGKSLADGLHYAHERGVLHRDIKPANVLLSAEGNPKLADFNISFNAGRACESPEDSFGGSLAYMSPEQIAACHPYLKGSPRLVREASDIYSMGVVLWEMLTLKRPFDDTAALPRADREPAGHIAPSQSALLERMLDRRQSATAEKLRERLPGDCPAALSQAICRCLDPDPARRFASAGRLARTLNLALEPRTWKLLQPARSLFGRGLLRFPVVAMLTAALIPNLLAAAFNLAYNHAAIVRALGGAEAVFFQLQAWINAVVFPLGLAMGVVGTRRQLHAFDRRGDSPADAGGEGILMLGRFLGLLSLALWLISGMVYPLLLSWRLGQPLGTDVYFHFATSLALCGLLAAAYPLLTVTFLCVRWILPDRIRRDLLTSLPRPAVSRTRQLVRAFAALAAAVPLLAILLMVLVSGDLKRLQIVMAAAGLIGYGGVYWIQRQIEDDLAALEKVSS